MIFYLYTMCVHLLMNTLHEPLLLCVFSYIPTHRLLVCRQVCKNFKGLIDKEERNHPIIDALLKEIPVHIKSLRLKVDVYLKIKKTIPLIQKAALVSLLVDAIQEISFSLDINKLEKIESEDQTSYIIMEKTFMHLICKNDSHKYHSSFKMMECLLVNEDILLQLIQTNIEYFINQFFDHEVFIQNGDHTQKIVHSAHHEWTVLNMFRGDYSLIGIKDVPKCVSRLEKNNDIYKKQNKGVRTKTLPRTNYWHWISNYIGNILHYKMGCVGNTTYRPVKHIKAPVTHDESDSESDDELENIFN